MKAWLAVKSLTLAQHKKGWRQHGWRYPFLLWAVARLLNEKWYLQHYTDVATERKNAFAHVLLYGLAEGRELTPGFSVSGYCYRYCGNARTPAHAVIHYWWWGRWRGLSPLPSIAGSGMQANLCGQLCLAVFAHSVGSRLYGAERSLLDALRTLETLGFAAVVVVPNASNPSYLDRLRRISRSVFIMPYGWWREGEVDHPVTLSSMQSLLKAVDANAVYINTLTLQAPSIAAKRLGLPVLTHVRELPVYDAGLCRALNSSAEGVVTHAVTHSDLLVVNSQCTANAFQNRGVPVAIVPNMVNMLAWQAVPSLQLDTHRPLRIGLLGSLIHKKGLEDFSTLADALANKGIVVECCLYGARTPDLEALFHQRHSANKKGNLIHKGYAEDPRDALANIDIVVNLSHFQESFGRTVLEAMAAARPVVAYDWGALPELVEHGVTGFLAPLGDVNCVAHWVETLVKDPLLLASMGHTGRQRAEAAFGDAAHQAAMAQALNYLCSLPIMNTEQVDRWSSSD